MAKLFNIKEDQIIFFPNKDAIVAAVIVFTCFIVTIVAYMQIPAANVLSMYIISFFFLSISIFFYFSSKTQIILDKRRETITKKSFGQYTHIASLDEVKNIQQNTHLAFTYFTIISHNDLLAEGERITRNIRSKSKKCSEVRSLINELNIMLQEYPYRKSNEKEIRCFTELNPNVFLYRKTDWIILIMGITLTTISSIGVYYSNTEILYLFVSLGLFVFGLFLISESKTKIKICIIEQCIEITKWNGLIKNKYHFNSFDCIIAEKSYLSGDISQGDISRYYSGVNIYLKKIDTNKKVSVLTSRKPKEATHFISDLSTILQKQFYTIVR